MIRSRRHAALSLLSLVFSGHAQSAAPDTGKNAILYELGVQMSGVLQTLELSESEFESVKQGLADGYHHRADLDTATRYEPQVQALRSARVAAITEREKRAGKSYVQRVAATPGARAMPSGLVYIPISEGSGAMPTLKDRVHISYVGRLIDGTVFDRSSARGEPSILALNAVMPCLSEALQLMKVGGKSRIVCPAELAYGDRGSLPDVLPGATLDFDIELLSVNPNAAANSPLSNRGTDRD